MTSTTELIHRSGNAPDLLVRRWAAAGEAWASVLIVHGLGEHGGRYERVGDAMAGVGLEVEAVDVRGAGGSAGRRWYIDRWSEYLDDVESRMVALRDASAGRPVVLLGHSFGGLIALDYATSGRPAPDLLILSSPAVESTIPAWKRTLAGALARVAPGMALSNGFRGEQLSSDPAVGTAYLADPLVGTSSTVRLATEAFAAQRRVATSAPTLAIPTLVTHGGADPIVPAAVSEPLAAIAGVRRIVYPGLRHETLNEPTGPAVAADMIAWLREQTAARGTGSALSV
jgi:alpha-beta hydrolase superfamily lysophospholipase